MSAGVALVTPQDCSGPCPSAVTTLIPGSPGADGAAGAAGTNGKNAYTTTTASFIVPAEGASVTIAVTDSSSFIPTNGGTPGENIRIEFAGTFLVTSKAVGTLTIKNLANTGAGLYTDNAAPTTVIPSGSLVSPSGLQGPAGIIPGGALLAANNLSDVAVAATARTNLGLGTSAVKTAGVANTNLPPVDTTFTPGDPVFATATGQQTKTAVATRTALGLGTAATATNGVANGNLPPVDTTFVNGDPLFATAAGVQSKTKAATRAALGVLQAYGILGSLTGVNLNAAASDNAMTMLSARYRIDKVIVDNASANTTTATAGVFTAAGGGGTTLAADQSLAALTASTKFKDLTLQGVVATDVRTEGTLYFRVGTAQGGADTASVFVFGWKLD